MTVNRRSFVKLLTCAAGAVGLAAVLPEKKYGRIVAGEYSARVSVNGVEVSNRCTEADDIQGYAICFKHDANGKPRLNAYRTEIERERLTGNVRIWNVEKWEDRWRKNRAA